MPITGHARITGLCISSGKRWTFWQVRGSYLDTSISIMEITEEHIGCFLAAAHEVGARRLTRCSSGNLSWRLGELALVSATGSWVPELRKEQVSVCRITTGEWINGVKPSMESTFHLTIMLNRPELNVVLRWQSIYENTVACMKNKPVDFNVKDELP